MQLSKCKHVELREDMICN